MSIVLVQRSRVALYLSICGLLVMVAAVSAVSARDPSGVSLRIGMVLMTVGAGLWLPWRFLIPAAIAFWLGPNYARSVIGEETFLNTNALLELPGIIGLAIFTGLARHSLRQLEDETLRIGATSEEIAGVDPETGVHEEVQLMPAIEAELARSRRFNRSFALVLVGIDSLRKRFDYRDEGTWRASFVSTARLLRRTRAKIDRVFRSGPSAFALILPETGADEVMGLIARLRQEARRMRPSEGEPGGPLPTHYGVTFFPQCATSAGDLLRRAAVALMIAERNSNRIQLDGAAAPEPPPPETMRTEELEIDDATGAAAEPHAVPEEQRVAVLATANANSTAAAGTDGSTGQPEAIPLDEAVAGLMQHLDETLSYIRLLKSDETQAQKKNSA
jgi:diguanylate cyclase (GGDEF)-like protein